MESTSSKICRILAYILIGIGVTPIILIVGAAIIIFGLVMLCALLIALWTPVALVAAFIIMGNQLCHNQSLFTWCVQGYGLLFSYGVFLVLIIIIGFFCGLIGIGNVCLEKINGKERV